MTAPVTDPDAERVEQLAALRAMAATAGWRVEVLPGGAIELRRWSRFRRFHSIELAAAFLENVGGRR